MKKLPALLLPICFAFVHELNAQILYTESFNVILDTSKTVKGSFMPSFRYRNVKKEFIEISNTADISFRHNNHALTLANKLEYTLYGNENLMSGGYVYVEYLNIQDRLWAIEPYIQIHWQETRGLEQKYAGGANLRLRVIAQPSTGIFVGLGALYQYERWNYSGVPESIPLPPNTPDIQTNQLRGSAYISIKKRLGALFHLDVSGYYQPSLGQVPTSHRLASSSELTYNITQYFGLSLLYQNSYDSNPVVPVNNLFSDVNLGITVSF
ncbi:MAG: DUF481 domain-containing protein [Bacteroidales bacterium]|nr:DUF481 domain-containing protein [Bacteroidales bacterium]